MTATLKDEPGLLWAHVVSALLLDLRELTVAATAPAPDLAAIEAESHRQVDEIYRLWTAIGERYAEVLEADRIHGDASEESDAATERWHGAERRIIDIRGTSASLLLMKLELVAASDDHDKATSAATLCAS